jgi:hypothetical protein
MDLYCKIHEGTGQGNYAPANCKQSSELANSIVSRRVVITTETQNYHAGPDRICCIDGKDPADDVGYIS